jgi:DNA topoisomerase-1
VTLRFRGKAGRIREVRLTDRRLARLIGRCLELPGRDLFGYLDDEGQVRDVRSADVNAYLRETAGDGVSAKDFRTWAGTLHAYRWLRATASGDDAVSARRVVVAAVKATAEELGNTPAVTRAAYIHPAVIEAFERGAVAGGRRRSAVDERAVIALLRGTATSG